MLPEVTIGMDRMYASSLRMTSPSANVFGTPIAIMEAIICGDAWNSTISSSFILLEFAPKLGE
jgi:hypothetical protein